MTTWMGVDVGGPKKGFDVAVVDGERVVTLLGHQSRADVLSVARELGPAVVAVDSPRRCAEPGETSRADERALRAVVCGIRWTPDEATVRRDGSAGYYGWVVEGLALHRALEAAGFRAIECFPTASWTRWEQPRGRRRRSAWSQAALAGLALDNVPARLNQDQRDAIAAAVTARQHDRGQTEAFGDLVVPRPGRP